MHKPLRLLTTLLAALPLLIAFGPAARADVMDQSFNPGLPPPAFGGFVAAGGLDTSQTFTVGLSGYLTSVSVAVAETADVNQDLRVDIRPVLADGFPDPLDSDVLASGTLSAASVPVIASTIAGPFDFAAIAFLNVDLSAANLLVTPGEVLAITLESDATSGGYAWAAQPGDPFVTGDGFYRGHSSTAPFNLGGADQAFETFVQPTPEASSVGLLLTAVLGVEWIRRRRNAGAQKS